MQKKHAKKFREIFKKINPRTPRIFPLSVAEGDQLGPRTNQKSIKLGAPPPCPLQLPKRRPNRSPSPKERNQRIIRRATRKKRKSKEDVQQDILSEWRTLVWIGGLLQRMCSTSCNNKNTKGPVQGRVTTPAGSQTCSKVNASQAESDYSQVCGGQSGNDQETERTTSCQGGGCE